MESEPGFTLGDYRSALRAFIEAGYAVTGFLPFLDDPQPRHMILRHDIDNSMDLALRMARIDADLGCRATYFLRLHARGYNLLSLPALLQVRELEAMGHEVELHLDGGLATTLGLPERRIADRQRVIIEEVLGRAINGFSSHEPSRLGNLEEADELRAAWGVRYHAYEKRFMMPSLKYLSDSSAHWREGHFRTWVGKVEQLQVLVHPIWWYEHAPQENQ
jgi:hypothetical protein